MDSNRRLKKNRENKKNKNVICAVVEGGINWPTANVLVSLLSEATFAKRVSSIVFVTAPAVLLQPHIFINGVPTFSTKTAGLSAAAQFANQNGIKKMLVSSFPFKERIKTLLILFRNRVREKHPPIKKLVFQAEKATQKSHLYMFFVWSSRGLLLANGLRTKKPKMVFLVDPISPSPIISEEEKARTIRCEKKTISLVSSYFVPQGWGTNYHKLFCQDKISEYKLPFLAKNLWSEGRNLCGSPRFLLLGSILTRKAASLAASYFTQKGLRVDVFGEAPKNLCFDVRTRLAYSELAQLSASYDFLVIVDNDGPWVDYLSSKLVTSISFGKPLIVFSLADTFNLRFLEPYPNKILIRDFEDFASLDLFISCQKGQCVSWDLIEECYGQNTAANVLSTIGI